MLTHPLAFQDKLRSHAIHFHVNIKDNYINQIKTFSPGVHHFICLSVWLEHKATEGSIFMSLTPVGRFKAFIAFSLSPLISIRQCTQLMKYNNIACCMQLDS